MFKDLASVLVVIMPVGVCSSSGLICACNPTIVVACTMAMVLLTLVLVLAGGCDRTVGPEEEGDVRI